MASVGFSRQWARTGLRVGLILVLSIGWGTTVHAQCRTIATKAGSLDQALLSLARQTGADIATTESGLQQIRVKPVAGCLSVSQALARLTRGSPYRALALGEKSYRIVKAPVRRATEEQARGGGRPAEDLPDIIVKGAKQPVTLLRFPGSVRVLTGEDFSAGIGRAVTLDDLAEMSPIMQKTDLGVGRNKLFIRGISDSSFNGPTQSTATVYFGDAQLNYSGSEPGIHLADMERVEILEGPQETLYGSGAISGIIRLAPHQADLDRFSASATGGLTMTDGGDPGYDATATLNLPIAKDKIALRLVGYRLRDGGYIDDTLLKASNVNRVDTLGGRAELRIEPGDNWSIEGGVLSQQIDAADAGYAETIVGPDSRRSILPQPYGSGITLWRGVLHKRWDSGLEMVSATGLVKTRGSDTFDATRIFPYFGPTIYQVDSEGTLLTHETRFSRTTKGVSWVAGLALLYDSDAESRVIGMPANPFEIIGVTNKTRSASAFGQATVPLSASFSVTAGARATIAQTQGEPTLTPFQEPSERGFLLHRVEPAVAVSWLLSPRLAAFARFQTGYRTGGIAVAQGLGRIANFDSDTIRVGEFGVRRERGGKRGISFSTAVSLARWQDIQADLYSRFAQPYTSNIGDATIVAVETDADWIPTEGLRFAVASLWTNNRTSGALAGTSVVNNRHLPDTPPFSGNFTAEYEFFKYGGHQLTFGGTVRYVGRSVLGTGSFLDLSQGDYAIASLAASWRWRNMEATLNLDNLTNESASEFAMGNPLTFGFREETVPMRPRSLRLALGMHW